MEIAILLILILLNGVFSMSEMALVSSRKTRLTQWADEGRAGSRSALALANEPSHFLSTVQVGITAIGIMSGIVGEAALAGPIESVLVRVEWLQPYAHGLAFALAVIAITTLALIFGELVPKRLALMNPEGISSVVARPMIGLSLAAYPLVRGLSFVTEGLVRLFGLRKSDEPPVTEEEIQVLMEQGRKAGVFDLHERNIVRRAFELDDLRVTAVMTPRRDLEVIRRTDDTQALHRTLRRHPHSRYPVVDDDGDIVGLLRTKRVVDRLLSGGEGSVGTLIEPAHYVPRTLTLMQLLESLKKARQHVAFVVDEYGHVQGMVTVNDVLSALVGEIGDIGEPGGTEDPDIVRRDDGSWLMSGSVDIGSFRDATDATLSLPEEDSDSYHTLGGLAMTALRDIPRVGDRFETDEFRFEVVDMDEHRVDKLHVIRKPPSVDTEEGA